MSLPEDRHYTKTHEWLRTESDGRITVGITDYAQSSLGDITYIQLPKPGMRLAAGETFGVVESVKAASDLYAPVAGEVVEVNEALNDAPETVNQSPYEDGWVIRIRPDAAGDPEGALDAAAYGELIA